MEYRLVGKRLPRIDALPKVTGKAVFIDDIVFSPMLHGKVLFSNLPHAKILNIDTSRANRVKGVKAVVTHNDLPETLVGIFIKDMPVLARGKVRFRGEPVVAVAAVDPDLAAEAVKLIQVDYQELPAVFDAEEAMRPEAPLVHENVESYLTTYQARRQGNICSHITYLLGDVEQGFAQADDIFEDKFETPGVHQGYLETAGAIVNSEVSGKVTVWASTQCPHKCQHRMSEGLAIPRNKIRVIPAILGGGFGGKEDMFFLSIGAALSQKSGQPVKIILGRDEEFFTMRPRHPAKVRVKTGVRGDGTIVARQVQSIFNTGAYSDQGPGVCAAGGEKSRGPYNIPNVQLDSYCVYTNSPISGAYRGFGNPQVSFAVESQMDMIAGQLEIDPLEFRLKNAVEKGSLDALGHPHSSVGLKECLRKVAELSRWHEPRPKNRAKGIAVMEHLSGILSTGTMIEINGDGSATVRTGAVDLGNGGATILAQIAAEELGLDLADIMMVMGDTDATPYNWSNAASRTAYVCGNSVKLAAEDAKRQLCQLAASQLEANPDDMVCQDKRVFVKGSPERGMGFSQLGIISHTRKDGPIMGKNSYIVTGPPVDPDKVLGSPMTVTAPSNFAAQVVELEVDPESGLVQVLHVWAAHDVGKAINPENVEGQIEGGFVQGLGYALFEKIKFNNGKALNTNLADYKLPTALDVPPIDTAIIENMEPSGPFGAKGAGEGPLVPCPPAIANAIFSVLGVRIKELPLTPEAVLNALRKKKKAS